MMLRSHGDRHFEMRRTGDAVELMQVIWHHAEIDEPLAKAQPGAVDRIV